MKPPPRKRIKRDVTFGSARGPSLCKLVCNWERAEQRKLLSGLKALNKAGDIDCATLKEHVPTRSTAEIESVIERLKDKIITAMCLKVENMRRDDRKVKKPIELWTQMASAVVGAAEKPITDGFSQMLLVSSAEPCTLRNSDPPRMNSQPTKPNSHPSHTVPVRPVLCMPAQVQLPAPITGPANRLSAPSQVVRVANKPPPPKQQSPTAAGNPLHASTSSGQSSESVSASTHTQTTRQHQTSTVCSATANTAATPPLSTSATASSSAPTHTTPASPPCLPKFGPTGNTSIKGRPRGQGMKTIVDFERIYKYLSVIHNPSKRCELTAMESAIVLDLLMSLPEELPLLDCKNLKKHLVQAYQTLSAPSDSKTFKKLLKDLKEAGNTERPTAGSQGGPDARSTRNPQQDKDTGSKALQQQETHSQSRGNTSTHGQCEDEDESLTDMCPPLNPFMVPPKLLMRKSSEK